MDRRHFLQTVNAFGVGAFMPASAQNEHRVGIVAIGGAGGNVLNDLAECLPQQCRTIAINTDVSALNRLSAVRKIKIDCIFGPSVGSDAGRRLAVRRQAQCATDEITEAVSGLDAVLLVAGMGGVAGTEIAPVVAHVLRQKHIVIHGVPIMPFAFESEMRNAVARDGARALGRHVQLLLPIYNDAFAHADAEEATLREVLLEASLTVLQLYSRAISTTSVDWRKFRY